MKRFYIAVILLITISTACLLFVNHLDKNTVEIKNQIYRIKDAVESGNRSDAEEKMNQLKNYWEHEKYLFHALAGSIYCDPFKSSLDRSEVWLGQKKDDELFAELSELYSRIDQLWDTQSIHPINIF